MADVNNPDWEELLAALKRRHAELQAKPNARRIARFIDHVKNLRRWEAEILDGYPQTVANFPSEISVAFAVCHPTCGVRQFIVDGGTQACQRCGRNMFRLQVQTYQLSDASSRVSSARRGN